MATSNTWIPHYNSNQSKQAWLLTNGQVIEAPDVETTVSERRFRVAGTAITGYKKDIENLIWQAVSASARAAKAEPWINLGFTNDSTSPLNDTEAQLPEAKLHFLTGASNTSLHWRFRHPSMPIDARLVAVLAPVSRYDATNRITVSMQYPSTDPRHSMHQPKVTINASQFDVWWDGIEKYGDIGQRLDNWIAKTKPAFLTEIPFGTHTFATEREAIRGLAKLARLVDDLDGVSIPDLRDPQKPGLLTLGLFRTNVTQSFMQSLSDYLDSTPIVTRVFESWQEIIKTFRSVGIVVGEIKKSDLYQLMTHQNRPVMVKIGPVAEEKSEKVINTHSVTFDLATGTIAVVCSGNTHGDEIATEYEAAKIRATLTGHTDELLAYAEEYGKRRALEKAQEIVSDRRKAEKQDPFKQ